MIPQDPFLSLRLATQEADLLGAQRLRYRVFVEELGGDGDLVDHANRLETDRWDPFFDHLILVDARRDAASLDHVVGVYRVLPSDRATAAGGYYSSGEYDLSPLLASGRKSLELGRSCVDAAFRGGGAIYHLWNGLADYVVQREIELLFGVASFHGTDLNALAQPLAYLYHNHLAPEDLRVRALATAYQPMDLLPKSETQRAAAMRATPALIKAYLRLGGYVGDGAFVDHAFNTVDVCVVMDTERMNARRRALYTKGAA